MNPYRVLIAEDEGLIAHDIANRMEAMGHKVVATAGTAEEAIELAVQADVVLMDIRLDGHLDGIDAAREIRARYHLPVIFLTAHADRRTLERAKLTEPFGYIVKPIAHATLQTTLEMAMYKHDMERKLEQRESWLRTTLSSVADAVVVTDSRGKALLANQAAEAIFGVDADYSQLLPGDPVALAIVKDAPVVLDTQIRDQSFEGSVAPVKVGGPVTNMSTIGCVVTLRNVTLERWREQQIRQAQKMEAAAKLAGSVAEQYTSLLAIVRTEAQRLLARFTAPSPVRQALQEIQHAALEAQDITGRLAGLGSRSAGRPQVVSVNGIVRRMRKAIESVLGPQLRLIIHTDASAAKTLADPDQMEQMILNLAAVAAASSEHAEGAELRIETANVSGYVELSLTCPSAGGMLALEDASTNLELSAAHSVATEFGGLLKIDSGGLKVSLPAWQEPESPLLPGPGVDAAGQTLLLIDSRDSVRTQLHNFFEAAGYNLLEAANREEALALLELHRAADGDPSSSNRIALVLGDTAATGGIEHIPVLLLDQPQFQAITQKELLEHVRSRLAPQLTFSASA